MKNLKIARKNSNLTQKEVASKLGIAPTTYANYEQIETCIPPVDRLIDIANLFDCSIDYLIGHRPQQNKVVEHMTDDQKRVMHYVKQMNSKEVVALLGVVARLTNTPLEEALHLNIEEA